MAQNYTDINDLVSPKKPISHAGASSKEGEPVKTGQEYSGMQEVVEHEPHKDVKAFVEVKQDSIELPPDLKKMGLQPVNQTQFPTYQNIKLPISDDKVLPGLHAPITSSIRWLAVFAVYLLKLAHIQLKVIHGKVVRVIRP